MYKRSGRDVLQFTFVTISQFPTFCKSFFEKFLKRDIENVFIQQIFCQIWLKSRSFFQRCFNLLNFSRKTVFSFYLRAFPKPEKPAFHKFTLYFSTISTFIVEKHLSNFTKKFFSAKTSPFIAFFKGLCEMCTLKVTSFFLNLVKIRLNSLKFCIFKLKFTARKAELCNLNFFKGII